MSAIDKAKDYWNSASVGTKVVITILVMVTSPLWFVPAFLVALTILTYMLIDLAMMPDDNDPW